MQRLMLLLTVVGTPLAAATTHTNPARPDAPSMLPAHRRQKRDWIWNQMHIDEEKNTSLPHYVGKVRLRPQRRRGLSSRRPMVTEAKTATDVVVVIGVGMKAIR